MSDATALKPFMSGWRVGAVNVLSSSLVVTALSSALTGVSGAQVAPTTSPAGATRVQLGAVPVTVAWPGSARSAFLHVAAPTTPRRTTVLEGLQPATVDACSTAWTTTGGCPGTQRRLPAVARDASWHVLLDGGLRHLKVTRTGPAPAAGQLVLRGA